LASAVAVTGDGSFVATGTIGQVFAVWLSSDGLAWQRARGLEALAASDSPAPTAIDASSGRVVVVGDVAADAAVWTARLEDLR
jgi:hypothetical protein